MLRGELTLTLRFLWFGSTAGLSSGLLTEGRSVTSDLVPMNPRSPARRRHTSTFTPVNETFCCGACPHRHKKQRFSVSRCSAERQLKIIAQNYRNKMFSASCSSARTKRQSVSTRLKLSSTITLSPLIPTPSMHPQQAKA